MDDIPSSLSQIALFDYKFKPNEHSIVMKTKGKILRNQISCVE